MILLQTNHSTGFVASNFLSFLPSSLDPIAKFATSNFARNNYEGALTSIFAATHPSLEGVGGIYLDSCKEKKPSALALDEELAAKFWEASEKAISHMIPPEWHEAMKDPVKEGEEEQQ